MIYGINLHHIIWNLICARRFIDDLINSNQIGLTSIRDIHSHTNTRSIFYLFLSLKRRRWYVSLICNEEWNGTDNCVHRICNWNKLKSELLIRQQNINHNNKNLKWKEKTTKERKSIIIQDAPFTTTVTLCASFYLFCSLFLFQFCFVIKNMWTGMLINQKYLKCWFTNRSDAKIFCGPFFFSLLNK